RLQPANRATQTARKCRHNGELREESSLGPEASPHRGRNDADICFAQVKQAGQAVAQPERHLGRGPDLDPAGIRIRCDYYRVRLHRQRCKALIDESASDDDFGALEGVAVAASPVGSHFFAARWIEYWWEGLPLDLNQLRGIRRCFQSLRQDDGHG